MNRTFDKPHVFKKEPGRKGTIKDTKESEEFLLLESLGNPQVFYAIRSNLYFKDAKCTNQYTDAELQVLGLSIPAEIANARKKLLKAAMEAGEVPDMQAIYAATCPKKLELPERLRGKLLETPAEELMIARINRSTSR